MPGTWRYDWRSRSAAVLASLALGAAGGCILLEAAEQEKQIRQISVLAGTVEMVGPTRSPLVVVLMVVAGEDYRIADHFVAPRPGRWFFALTPGRYALAAFEDRNRNLVYDPDEPALRVEEERVFDLGPGEQRDGIELRIHPDGRARVDGPVDLDEFQRRTFEDQLHRSIGQFIARGEIIDLQSPRFGPESGKMGLWRPLDFVAEVHPGVYFLEEYDPDRVPVLFVHGVSGHPREFEALARGLDRERFQAWFAFYPSGANLRDIVANWAALMADLRHRLGFDEVAVVGHSAGGLVARGLLLRYHEQTERRLAPLLVSIATPWGGDQAAKAGVEKSPVVMPSWRSISPGSLFLNALFWQDADTRQVPRWLPRGTTFHLIFAFRRRSRSFGPSGDGVIPLDSQLFAPAQREAASVYGIDGSHASILRDPETSRKLNEILAAEVR